MIFACLYELYQKGEVELSFDVIKLYCERENTVNLRSAKISRKSKKLLDEYLSTVNYDKNKSFDQQYLSFREQFGYCTNWFKLALKENEDEMRGVFRGISERKLLNSLIKSNSSENGHQNGIQF